MSERPPKAKDMNWVNPYLIVKDMKNSLEFYEKVFGFQVRMTMPDKDGNPMHAELTHKDGVIMMGTECPESGSKSPSTIGGTPVSFYLYVDNINEFFQKAKEAGVKIHQEPTDQFWGDRMCHLECPEGHQWSFAQNVADFDPSKAPK